MDCVCFSKEDEVLKKGRVIAIAAVLILLLVSACNSKVQEAPAEIAGRWLLCSAEQDGVKYTLQQLEEYGIETYRSINFIDDTQVVLSVGIRDDSQLGSTGYTFDGRIVRIPEADMDLILHNGQLVYQTEIIVQIFERVEESGQEQE